MFDKRFHPDYALRDRQWQWQQPHTTHLSGSVPTGTNTAATAATSTSASTAAATTTTTTTSTTAASTSPDHVLMPDWLTLCEEVLKPALDQMVLVEKACLSDACETVKNGKYIKCVKCVRVERPSIKCMRACVRVSVCECVCVCECV